MRVALMEQVAEGPGGPPERGHGHEALAIAIAGGDRRTLLGPSAANGRAR